MPLRCESKSSLKADSEASLIESERNIVAVVGSIILNVITVWLPTSIVSKKLISAKRSFLACKGRGISSCCSDFTSCNALPSFDWLSTLVHRV